MTFHRINCPECKTAMALKPYTHTEQVGPVEVFDPTRFALTCPACGETSVSDSKLQWYELRAAATVLREGTNVTPEVIQYARKTLGLTIPDFEAFFWSPNCCGTRQDNLELAAVLDGVASGQFTIHDYIAKWSLPEPNCLKKTTSIELRKKPIREDSIFHCTICRKQTPHKWKGAENTYCCTVCGEAQR